MEDWFSVGWDVLPGFCTNVVFCCLFLGTPVPRAKEVLKSPRREHLIFGLIVVFGQYVVSSGFTGFWMLFDPSLDDDGGSSGVQHNAVPGTTVSLPFTLTNGGNTSKT